MIGRSTTSVHPFPKKLIQGLCGVLDIHTRQKWQALWPILQELGLPPGSTLLDAGCGAGDWTIELASRHPEWKVLGIDRDEKAITAAKSLEAKLKLPNASFQTADFLSYRPTQPFDLVLSTCSAHYLALAGHGEDLFRQMRSWLKKGGHLLLLGPRQLSEVPAVPWLGFPEWHEVFSADALRDYCSRSGFEIMELAPVVGTFGTLAKQFDLAASKNFGRCSRILYPATFLLNALDVYLFPPGDRSTLWRLVAAAA